MRPPCLVYALTGISDFVRVARLPWGHINRLTARWMNSKLQARTSNEARQFIQRHLRSVCSMGCVENGPGRCLGLTRSARRFLSCCAYSIVRFCAEVKISLRQTPSTFSIRPLTYCPASATMSATAAGEIIADHVLTTGDEVVEQVRSWPKE
jgi:hypothetical protein